MKKRRRRSDAEETTPEEIAVPPEWEPMARALAQADASVHAIRHARAELARPSSFEPLRMAERGGALAHVLARVLELHSIIDGGDRGLALTASLQPPLRPLGVCLGERAGAATRRAIEHAEEAVGGTSVEAAAEPAAKRSARVSAAPGEGVAGHTAATAPRRGTGGGGGTRSGPPTWHELSQPVGVDAGSSASSRRPAAGRGTHFRDAYMALLAHGAPDELDALRTEEPPMDEAALAMLVDALEHGAQTFAPTQQRLFEASFGTG